MKSSLLLILIVTALGCTNSEFDAGDLSKHDPWVIRTCSDRTDVWTKLKQQIASPQGSTGFRANVKFVDDPIYYGLTGIDLVRALPSDYPSGFVFVVDGTTSEAQEDLVTLHYFFPDSDNVADYQREPAETPDADLQTVKLLPSAMQEIENNLSISNIDMADVFNGLSSDKIYRGIKQ